ncbi:aminopeptidase M1 [Senna tora]|uniref:Aminopeptidase M1 n=1 Tax=Senna tora TaxID=362788 RepID=A0A834XGC6_9FABA|nr:aminopeptidase M1 [Senna tora]
MDAEPNGNAKRNHMICMGSDSEFFVVSHVLTRVEINHAHEIDEIFDAISYREGGPRSLASYIKRYACSNAKTEDLWAALEEGYGEPVNKLMDSWTKQKGCPVVSVKVNNQKLEFEQEKFGSHMRESFDGTSEDNNNDDDDDVDIVCVETTPSTPHVCNSTTRELARCGKKIREEVRQKMQREIQDMKRQIIWSNF